MKITLVVGARPNFMKIAPIIRAIKEAQDAEEKISYRLVHTGQHYDKKMSAEFFEELNIPKPDINLGAGSGTQAEQTASIMVSFEKDLMENKPDIVLVVGDVTSTLACSITAKKLCIDVGHVEAGIRSGDMTMPEEINRMVTDAICDHFFTTSELANVNLRRLGVQEKRIHFVGNTMIDTLYQNIDRLRPPKIWDSSKLSSQNYFLITLHRPSNVDDVSNLTKILETISENSFGLPVVFPIHPRTKKILESVNYQNPDIIQTEPMGYLEFIYLVKNARAVITDSGGITEETTVLGIPCLTLRNSTERPETITMGTNELVGTDPGDLAQYLKKLLNGKWKEGKVPPLWDGKTSTRIIQSLIGIYNY
ncbi:MAG: UDP-N-acetylglucosamine 2-epimerase (non-hydrolyzing) [Chitinophagaceae bacterium]|nr:UDP-N-acetylglucosamine 2-epimerase (non-hydrolyzing) [Chitinophagaceae bacterium]